MITAAVEMQGAGSAQWTQLYSLSGSLAVYVHDYSRMIECQKRGSQLYMDNWKPFRIPCHPDVGMLKIALKAKWNPLPPRLCRLGNSLARWQSGALLCHGAPSWLAHMPELAPTDWDFSATQILFVRSVFLLCHSFAHMQASVPISHWARPVRWSNHKHGTHNMQLLRWQQENGHWIFMPQQTLVQILYPHPWFAAGVDGKEGALCASGPVTASAWQHTIDRWKHPRVSLSFLWCAWQAIVLA